ncbi:hypothetical protein MYX82_04915 [Acidobacteria bacterium AH-259-D05]|nr:hypothetical protein [Acidobacteria bacterium AH-259-D05]
MNRIGTVVFLAGLLLGVHLALAQTATTVSGYTEAAEERASSGDYPEAIQLYQMAINAERSAGRKSEIQEALNEVTRRFAAELYDQARQATSREEKIKLLVQSRTLDLRDWLFTDFQEVVVDTQRLSNEIFEELQKEAETAAGVQDYDQVISLYDQARELDPNSFEMQDLETQYQEIKDQIRLGQELASQGEQLIRQGKYQEASEKFDQADQVYPGQEMVEAGRRRVDSMLLLLEGIGYAEADRFTLAERVFERALETNQDNDEATRLLLQSQNYQDHVHRGRILYRQGSCEGSQDEFRQAQSIDARRFTGDNLASVLSGDCAEVIPLPATEIREALLYLFDGTTDDSIQIMETLLEEIGESHLQVSVFLGVAYSYAAWTTPEPDTQALERAKQQFRTVLHSQPDYQLSEKLFSPRILGLFEELRLEITGGR